MSGRMLKVDEAAALLNVEPRVLRRLAREGEVPCIKVGAEWRFPPDLVEQMTRRFAERAVRTYNEDVA